MFDHFEYAGFWVRLAAFVIDSILLALVSNGLMFAILALIGIVFGENGSLPQLTIFSVYLFSSVFVPLGLVCGFWIYKQATPGKMLFSLKVVHADTFKPLSPRQALGRYLLYFVSSIVLMLGFFWIAIDPKKRAWHDLIAKTVVIRDERL